jgi:hypothetical protein
MAKTKDEKAQSATQPEDSGIGHVPDPPFHGKHHLSIGVDFANAEGGETRIEPGIIDGTDLPIDVAESLTAGGHLRKV